MKITANISSWMLIAVSGIFFNCAIAQLKGDHLLSDAGLQAGTQPIPSFTVLVPAYNYHTSTFKNSDGDKLSSSPSLNMFVTGIGGSVVSNFKVLHANWGATLLIPFASNKIEGNLVSSKSSLAFSDIYFQPVQLGWKTKKADFTAGYALYIPSGKYESGGSDNSGLGMYSNEFSAGTTLYFDQKKLFSFSTLLSYAVASEKKGTDIKTGDILSIEGGAGRTWYKKRAGPVPMIINAGMVYYMQFKVGDDKIPIGNTYFSGSADHIYALGAEGNILFPKTFTSIIIRWLGEMGAKNRFEGNSFFLTVAQTLKVFVKEKK